MSSGWFKFKALFIKNVQTMKRNIGLTIVELLFPPILMLIGYLVLLAFSSEKHEWNEENGISEYLVDKGNIGVDYLMYFIIRKCEGEYGPSMPECYAQEAQNPKVLSTNELTLLRQYMVSYGKQMNQKTWNYVDPLETVHPTKVTTMFGTPLKPLTTICYDRYHIGFVGFTENDELGYILSNYINIENTVLKRPYVYHHFDTVDELNSYISADDYGTKDKPLICFAVAFKDEGGDKYKASLHYFDNFIQHGIQDVPNNLESINDFMQQGPNMNDIKRYSDNGYLPIMTILSNYMLKKKYPSPNPPAGIPRTLSSGAGINFGFAVQKYDKYKYNKFSEYAGLYVTFFAVLSYLCPLILYVLKMVVEKESRAKEVMKIMGMGELSYFLSYFVLFFIINIYYAFVVAIFSHLMFNCIPYLVWVLYLWLFGLNVFAIGFFCQSFMDTTKLALIISTLIYCLMLFVSAAVYDDNVKKYKKVLASLLPPVNLFLGSWTLGLFQGMFYKFKAKDINENYRNYSMKTCYLMFTLDFFIYLILGWYLLNVVPHEYGMSRPWYFLFTPSYWCKSNKKNKGDKKVEIKENNKENKQEQENKNKENNDEILNIVVDRSPKPNGDTALISNEKTSNNIQSEEEVFNDNPHKGESDFQNEDLYRDRDGKNDVFKLRDVKKIYSDGKCAVAGVSFNLFRNEIFALLGRNGAGKTSLINVLIGMYEATSGSAIYKEKDILDDLEMDNFRKKLGICPQHDILFPDLTVREHLEMFCHFKGFPSDRIYEEVESTLKDFRIHDLADTVAGTLSAGQRRKLSIAIAVVGGSEVIFLDEPSSGMDITSRRNLWEILKKIIDKRIIILTTHYMEEASVLGNRIGIMAEGVLKCIGTPLFLIENHGKFMSVNIYKEKGAKNEPIIEFFKSKADNIEYEVLSQEILFRIPKVKKGEEAQGKTLNIESFFKELDSKSTELNIRSYSASMPTLEDVFLNIGSVRMEEEEMLAEGKVDEEKNEQILFKQKYIKEYSFCSKFCNDTQILLKKRLYQIYRDLKTLFMEIICPILLVIVGCLVVQVDIFKDTDPIIPNSETLSKMGKQVIYYGSADNVDTGYFDKFKFSQTNVTTEFLKYDMSPTEMVTANAQQRLAKFIEKLYEVTSEEKENFGALFKLNIDDTYHHYDVVEIINGKARQAPMVYGYTFLNQILKQNDISLDFVHHPLPTTKDIKSNSKALNNYCLVFFVSIAFALIPANFISSIVRERINNSKHLMRISGVSLIAYWMVNFIFELVKYYVTGGICLLILWAFDFVPSYLYILYLLYGPSMVAITYLMSYLFKSEAIAQNAMILFNLVLGSLGATVVIMLRSIDNTTKAGKFAAFIFRIIPSFAFGYGYNLLLNGKLILFIDFSIEYKNKPKSTNISLSYAGADALYMAIETVVYILCLCIIEKTIYSVSKVEDGEIDPENTNKLEDENVKEEIKRANDDKVILLNKEDNDEVKTNDVEKTRKLETPQEGGENSESRLILNTNLNLNQDNSKKQEKDTLLNNEKAENTDTPINVEHNNNEQEVNEGTTNYKNVNTKTYAVKIKNLQKIYSGTCTSMETVGVKNISFCVEYGECFGMLGLNGAGKTTIFKAITQEHGPTHGSIFVNGEDISSNFEEVKNMFGYCPQFDAIFEYMTVYENLEFYSRIKGVDPSKLSSVTNAMIQSMTLSKYRNKLAGRLSGGNKRKLSVAISMICNPPIVLLDEPSTGMDPEARRFMWAIIHNLSSKNKTNCVIMTTHSMDEAETLCRRMGIMVNGEFVCLGTANQIKENYGYGFEIDVRIKPLPQEKMDEILNNLSLKKNYKITSVEEAKDILTKMGKEKFAEHLAADKIGRQIYNELTISGSSNITSLISWTHYVKNAIKMISSVLSSYEEIILTEFIENNFLYKIKKSENAKSIGFLFTTLEQIKDKCEITEYSIQQTSLEQIFNKFAENQGKTEEDMKKAEKKVEILINQEIINDLGSE